MCLLTTAASVGTAKPSYQQKGGCGNQSYDAQHMRDFSLPSAQKPFIAQMWIGVDLTVLQLL